MNILTRKKDKRELNSLLILSLLILITLMFLSSGCTDKCEVTHTYFNYEPVFTAMEEIRESLIYEPPKEINSPGRIYYKDGYIYINEIGEGIHIIDNRNPRSPKKLGFLAVPGNFDLAAKGNYLYADSYVDLVVLNISDPSNIREESRLEEVFVDYDMYLGLWDNQSNRVLTEWTAVPVETTFDGDCEGGNFVAIPEVMDISLQNRGTVLANGGNVGGSAITTGIGGSMARFTIYDDYLYTINSTEMRLFDISQLTSPEVGTTIYLGWGIETIFPYGDKLFLGAINGMHIYDNQTPENPQWISTYEHINSCDPVVVQDNFAYVTLRSGTECQGFTNQLDIVDVSDLSNPTLFKSYAMQNPHGLGIDGSCLFITEGDFGLKFFDASDPDNLELQSHQKDLHAIDVIPLNEILMVIGNSGFQQYEYDCFSGEFELLSTIQITEL